MSIATHELTHALADRCFPTHTRWFHEGLAQFVETYEWSYDWKAITVGRPNISALRLDIQKREGMRSLFDWGNGGLHEADDDKIASRYAYAWAVVHYLVNQEPE